MQQQGFLSRFEPQNPECRRTAARQRSDWDYIRQKVRVQMSCAAALRLRCS